MAESDYIPVLAELSPIGFNAVNASNDSGDVYVEGNLSQTEGKTRRSRGRIRPDSWKSC